MKFRRPKYNIKNFLNIRKHPLPFFLGSASISLSYGFFKYLNQTIYFPFFPNIIDILILMFIGFYLLDESLRPETKTIKTNKNQ